ncbi:nucleoside triphosphate pyrophosphohydrolase [Enterovibrio norvegicus]|uniref:Nucleoside triphosphate pyrophosphohydrolase n=1 Tax=Enterovibrio norvegicus TaxID=188144 RepID=A0A2N7LC37_9GAMM|nr:nucleoside triphosphate pyrophosphohydrolase [Enterovibrio norvegicus]PML78168.1 nucleoside triphosphate pyrophosphohydrolase [Enterovibrio norvegicus]PMN92886.1 nucleoside triphosphate pyrophosphohydrolase [Enterovibrio norvegicus]
MKNASRMQELLEIMTTLRDPENGCPWDKKQTFDTIIPYTIEETYEVADAIERQNWPDVRDELGDLLFQIVFYSQLGKEQGDFDFDDVVDAISEKLVRRHPHVFGEKDQDGNPLVEADWEGIKAKERELKADAPEHVSVLDDVPNSLPALGRAMKLQKRCARVGFDWDAVGPVAEKVHEELDEVMEEALMVDVDQTRVDEEIGDLLFAVVNLARHLGTNPEIALRNANRKFEKRFRNIETKLRENGKNLQESGLDELEMLWQEVKRDEGNTAS